MDMLEKYIFLNNLVDNMGAIEPSVKDALTRLSTPTLYHGTDVRIVNMSENERRDLHQRNEGLADYLFEYYKPHCDKYGILQDINERVPNDKTLNIHLFAAVANWTSKTEGANYWQYETNGIYLTQSIIKARGYAYNARHWGEVGSIAYWMIKGLKPYGITIDNYAVQDAIDYLVAFSEEKPQPVVYAIDDVDYRKLRAADTRKEADIRDIAMISDVYYSGDVKLTDENAFYLKPE